MPDKPDLAKYDPSCVLVHTLINKLAVIVGHCDLLTEEIQEDPSCLSRVQIIRSVAKKMAEDLSNHQSDLDSAFREMASGNKPPSGIGVSVACSSKRA